MKAILSLFALGVVVVIVTQFVKAGSAGPAVIGGTFNSISRYIGLLK